jgi:biopolymer transport protein ExbD
MTEPNDTVFVQPQGDSDLQSLVDVLDALQAAGMTNLVIVGAE